MRGESGVTRRIIDELHFSDIQGDQMEGESGLTRRFIDELHCWDSQGGQREGQSMVFIEVSLMNFILGITEDIKWKVKVVLL